MNGGMKRAAGPGAVAALAALVLSSGSVLAADLGGNCCADLEERVAELEATTARKGNRKVSLTVYGWVNKGILYWNDGVQSNTYFGVDNTNYATRFGFRGDAKITPEYTAGFNILIDVITGATTSGVSASREDRSVDVLDKFGNVIGTPNAWQEDSIVRMRDANVWVESKRLGRFTVGHLTNPGPQGIVDLGGTVVASGAAIDLVGGSFAFRKSAGGGASKATIANNTTNVADFSHRTDSIRWDSPTVSGFVLSAAYGEAGSRDLGIADANATLDAASMNGPIGPYWAVALRYAGEFSGFRVAAAAAYEQSRGEERMGSSSPLGVLDTDGSNNTGYSASILHIASGLFAQGSWIRFERPNLVTANDTGKTAEGGGTEDGTLWQIQGGIARNWTGLGNTVLYGEYARGENLQRTFSPVTVSFTTQAIATGGITTPVSAINNDNTYTMWGLGVVQNIDAAALELYLTYRRHSLDHDAFDLSPVHDIDMVFGGMRIAF